MKIWIFAGAFFVILTALATINYRVNKQFKIDTSWLALGLIPVVLWLLTTEQLSEFSGLGLAFKLNKVTAKPFSLHLDGNRIEPEQISSDEKESLAKIPDFVRKKVAAVTLKLHRTGYYQNGAIRAYLEALTPHSFFKYVLFTQQSGEFVGIMDADKLLSEMKNNDLDIVSLVETGNIRGRQDIIQVSISEGGSKQKALQIMNERGLSQLPVADEQGVFMGIVERDKITSSIVAQLVSASGK